MKNFKKSSIALLTAIYITVDVFGSLLIMGPVKAQGLPVADSIQTSLISGFKVKDEVQMSTTQVLTTAAMGALVNALSYFVRKLSKDTATYIAAGGKGQGALIFKDGIGEYMKNTALDTVGEAVGSLGQPFGLNLCEIPNPQLDINMRIGYRNMFPSGSEPAPKCSWKKLEGSWGDIGNVMEKRYGPGGSKFVSETFNANLSVSESDFGIALDGLSQLDNIYSTAEARAQLERTVTNGIKDIVGPISGKVTTPASIIEQDLTSLAPSKQAEKTEGQIAGIYGSSLQALPGMAASIFLNTLLSSLLTNITSGLFSDSPDSKTGGSGLSSNISSFYASALQSTKKSAERVFDYLTAPTIKQIDDYKVVDQLFSQKAIDAGLQQAVNRGNNLENMMTIGEALDLNFLHRDWTLIPPSHVLNSSVSEDCYLKAYCYSNLQKLRKARILPIGFELAALKSPVDAPWTLGKVIDGFDDCNTNNSADADHLYCHLIDPNWVLKSPEANCKMSGIGPELLQNGVNARKSDCMDLETCISKSDDGTCNAWGYCTKEENIWRLGGASCPDYYSTCTTYNNTETKQASSYLSRTVDFGQCDIKSVGCQAYSSEQIKNLTTGKWSWVTTLTINTEYKGRGRNQMLYLNRDVETCPAGAEGCTAFYGAQRDRDSGIFNINPSGNYTRDSANLIHLKKAPDYLSCYDTDASNALIIDWPKSKTEVLTKLAASDTRCSDFAQICAPEEAGCGRFNPTKGGSQVTAIVAKNNACPQECVGYESFKQEESNFEAGKFPLYFIPDPSSVKTCSVRSVGCSEFTNLSAGSGGESLVYYSYTRLCEKPDNIDEKTFFSWEGSASEGYVLRNHLLKTINTAELAYVTGLNLTYSTIPPSIVAETVGEVFPEGSPSYGDNTKANMQDNYIKCNANSYKLLINNFTDINAADADCRQLYDSSGKIFYRILRDTVIIDESCQKLRKSEMNLFVDTSITGANAETQCNSQKGIWNSTLSTCQRCYGGGKNLNGECIYESLPSESDRCSSADNGCRAYTGNAGNNIRPNIIFDTFEGAPFTAMTNWNTGSVVTESLQTGQHSLRVNTATVERTIPVGTIDNYSLNQNGWYTLSFWSRGASRTLEISFDQTTDQGTTTNLFTNSISVGSDWQEYRLGPVQFTGKGNSAVSIKIVSTNAVSTNSEAGDYFIDNFSLSQVEDSIYLVKDSWKKSIDFNGQNILADVPASCYMGVAPGGSLPGAALGCREFKDESNNTYYLTGFSALCREAAVGCQPMFESNNTVGERFATVYNLLCTGPVGNCALTGFLGAAGSCFINPGETGCYVPKTVLPLQANGEYTLLSDIPGAYIDISTVYIPPENARPVYLTNVEKYQCGADNRGCTLLGLQDQTIPTTDTASYKYTDTYVLNNPEYYESVLCRQDLIGCYEYTSGANAYYFKDPVKNGNYICSYRDDVDGFSGWFKDNVGACSNDDTVLCKEDGDCGTNNTCTKIDSIPCYPDYLQDGNYYNIWSNKSTEYEGFVGACEQIYGGCTELLDPADTSSFNPDGKPYYRVFDNRLTANVSDCEGQVSLKNGCVLFNKTNQPNKLYNTQLTYTASDNATPRYSLVNPVASTLASNPNNANIILKVNRDRECSEWLACQNSSVIINNAGKKETQCSKYKICDKLKTTGGQQSVNEGCLHFVEPVSGQTFLDESKYLNRDVSWWGIDYSGYSILQKYQIGSFEYVSFSGDDNQYLAASMLLSSDTPNVCISATGVDTNTMGNRCGEGYNGRCYGSKCIYTIDGAPFKELTTEEITPPTGVTAVDEQKRLDLRASRIEKMRLSLLSPTCKIYPEDKAPFPRSMAAEATESIGPGEQGKKSEIKLNDLVDSSALDVEERTRRTEFVVLNDNFSEVNICQTDASDCSCGYKKYMYGTSGVVDYYPVSNSSYVPNVPEGVCVGGDKGGQPCKIDQNCSTFDPANDLNGDLISSGSCTKLKQIDTKLGLFGFCLEPDLSRPINGQASRSQVQEYACQTWLPIQTSASNIDLNNLNIGAGYDPKTDGHSTNPGGEVYCANSLKGGIVSKNSNLNFTNPQSSAARSSAGRYSAEQVFRRLGHRFYSYTCDADLSTPIKAGFRSIDGTNYPAFELGKALNNDLLSYDNYNYHFDEASFFFNSLCLQKKPEGAFWQTLSGGGTTGKAEFSAYAQSEVYETIQAWAWNKIGPNAVVIRAEHDMRDDSSGGFAPPNNGSNSKAEFLATEVGVTGNNGRFVFPNSDKIIDENNIKNIYFIPLSLKGEMRGIVPRQINKLADLDPLTDTNNFLKLPIQDMKNGSGAIDRSIKAFKSGYIRHFANSWDLSNIGYPVDNSPGLVCVFGNCWHRYDQNSVFNFTGQASDFIEGSEPRFTYNLDEIEDYKEGEGDIDRRDNPFLVWRYKNDHKYVLSWFANNTGQQRYVSKGDVYVETDPALHLDGPPELPLNTPDDNEYDTAAPSFMGTSLSAGGVIAPNFTKDPPSTSDDPFNVPCQTGYVNGSINGSLGTKQDIEHHNAWWAVAVNFDINNKFLGFTTRWCDGVQSNPSATYLLDPLSSGFVASDPVKTKRFAHWTLTGQAGINYAVIVELETQCTEFVKVINPGAGIVGTKNKAWTNRVWKNAKNQDDTTPLTHPVLWSINKNTPNLNFGSTYLGLSADNNAMKDYFLNDETKDGIPYACAEVFSGTAIGNVDISAIKKCGFPTGSSYRKPEATAPYNDKGVIGGIFSSTLIQAYQNISLLFAKFFGSKRVDIETTPNSINDAPSVPDYSGGTGFYGEVTKGVFVGFTGNNPIIKEYLLPPRIFSLNPFTCPEDGSGDCTAGDADNITVNQRNGVKSWKDYNDDGIASADELAQIGDHVAKGSFDANVKFFAYADDNRMPIRKITVNWGDGVEITNQNTRGFYKNSKPSCSTNTEGELKPLCEMREQSLNPAQLIPSGIICNIDSDCPTELLGGSVQNCLSTAELTAIGNSITYGTARFGTTYGTARFGNTPRACMTTPYEFGHSYTCPVGTTSVSDLSEGTRAKVLAMDSTLNSGSKVCVFKPRVQVIDNWGYCNGVCQGGDGGNYCYSGGEEIFTNNGPTTSNIGECEWPNFSTTGPNPNQAPYTEYSGNIVIIP